MGLRGVDFGEQESSLKTSGQEVSRSLGGSFRMLTGSGVSHLAAAVLRVDIPWHGEAGVQQLLSIVHRCLEQVLEVLVLGHILVPGLLPLSYSLRQTQQDRVQLTLFKLLIFQSNFICKTLYAPQ